MKQILTLDEAIQWDILTKYKWIVSQSLQNKEGLTINQEKERKQKLKETISICRYGNEIEFDLYHVTENYDDFCILKPKKKIFIIRGTGRINHHEYLSEMETREALLNVAIQKELEEPEFFGSASAQSKGKFNKNSIYA